MLPSFASLMPSTSVIGATYTGGLGSLPSFSQLEQRAKAWKPVNDNKIGLVIPEPDIPQGPVLWEPQVGPQALAIAAKFVDELLFGGARGGGKSDFLLGDFLQDVPQGPLWRGIIFRKSYPELEELLVRAKEIFLPYGAQYRVAEKTFVFPSGATLKFRHLESENDADLYQGHQYAWIGWDELGNWPNLKAYNKLKACLRSAQGAKNKRIRASANPGGVGHLVVRHYFIDPAPSGMDLITKTDEDGHTTSRMYIPSKVYDNKILLENDPLYISRLREIGSPELVKAWLEGDWNAITGAYFPEFSTLKHVIKPFVVPSHWLRFRAMDWGSSSPFCVLWFAVSDGIQVPDGPYIPSGALVVYREWYGVAPGQVNVGIKMHATRVGEGIAKREQQDNVSYGVIDPSAFKWDGGPSHAERMAKVNVFFRKADNNRIGGWDMVRERLCGLDGDPDVNNGVGTPMLYIFDTCVHLIRTLPALSHDNDRPEDADTEGEDHAPDTLRYGVMSRPWTRPQPKKDPMASIKLLQNATLNDIWRDHEEHDTSYVESW